MEVPVTVEPQKLRPAPSTHARRFDGELVILDLSGGEYFALDAIGARLWDGLLAGKTAAEIAAEIVAEYSVTIEQATADLQELAEELRRRGLLIEGG
jgi:hypothetical protein